MSLVPQRVRISCFSPEQLSFFGTPYEIPSQISCAFSVADNGLHWHGICSSEDAVTEANDLDLIDSPTGLPPK
jgi:hypothetical protein